MKTRNRNRIAVIEDDPLLGPMIRKILEKHGFEATVVADGYRALGVLSSGGFDAAILDIALPGVDGITILRQLRSREVNGQLPVLMLTANTDDMTTWNGWKAGANYFMNKPFDAAELVRVLRSITQSL